VCSDNLLQL
jgi:FAD/FMN-containing dehydrogenase